VLFCINFGHKCYTVRYSDEVFLMSCWCYYNSVVLAVNSWRLVATKEMALLIVCMAYTGQNLCELF